MWSIRLEKYLQYWLNCGVWGLRIWRTHCGSDLHFPNSKRCWAAFFVLIEHSYWGSLGGRNIHLLKTGIHEGNRHPVSLKKDKFHVLIHNDNLPTNIPKAPEETKSMTMLFKTINSQGAVISSATVGKLPALGFHLSSGNRVSSDIRISWTFYCSARRVLLLSKYYS